jgi:hypothetical protein
MKIRKINILLFLSLGAIIVLSGCSKNDGAVTDKVPITAVPTITTNIDPTGSASINMLNLAAFSGKFKVDNYFPGQAVPSKFDIVVRKTKGTTINNSNVKVFKTGLTALPSSFTVTSAEIAALFGTAITLGDNYDFGPDFYVGERKFEAFPAVGNGTGAGLNGQPLYGEFARFSAICAYDPTIYVGDFEVVSDGFGELSAGTVVTLSTVSATKFRATYPNPAVLPQPPVPSFVVDVNTGNNNVSSTQQQLGTNFYQYTNPSVQVASGTVSPCDKEVTMNITYRVAQGSFGTFALRLRKKP